MERGNLCGNCERKCGPGRGDDHNDVTIVIGSGSKAIQVENVPRFSENADSPVWAAELLDKYHDSVSRANDQQP
jgi:hypothetical protein